MIQEHLKLEGESSVLDLATFWRFLCNRKKLILQFCNFFTFVIVISDIFKINFAWSYYNFHMVKNRPILAPGQTRRHYGWMSWRCHVWKNLWIFPFSRYFEVCHFLLLTVQEKIIFLFSNMIFQKNLLLRFLFVFLKFFQESCRFSLNLFFWFPDIYIRRQYPYSLILLNFHALVTILFVLTEKILKHSLLKSIIFIAKVK